MWGGAGGRVEHVCVRQECRSSGSGWVPVIFPKGERAAVITCEGMALIFQSLDEISTRFATGVWITLFRVDHQLLINTRRNHALLVPAYGLVNIGSPNS